MTTTPTTASERLAELSTFVRANLAAPGGAHAEMARMSERALVLARRDHADAKATCAKRFKSNPPEPGSPQHMKRLYEEMLALLGYSPRHMHLDTAWALVYVAWLFVDRNADTATPILCPLQSAPWEDRSTLAGWLEFPAFGGRSAAELALEALATVKASRAVAHPRDLDFKSDLEEMIVSVLAGEDPLRWTSSVSIAQSVQKMTKRLPDDRAIRDAISRLIERGWPIERADKIGFRIPTSRRGELPEHLRAK